MQLVQINQPFARIDLQDLTFRNVYSGHNGVIAAIF
jgi:hypothetical protein